MTYDITEIQAYRLANGSIVAASDLTPFTAYQTGDGTMYASRDEAKASLVSAAIAIIGAATADDVAAAAQNANTDQAQKTRLAIMYLGAIMQGAA